MTNKFEGKITITRAERKEMDKANARLIQSNSLNKNGLNIAFSKGKLIAKKVVMIAGVLVTLLTYQLANGEIMTVQAQSNYPVGQSIQIHSGDTLYSIANKYGTSVQHIKNLNGMKDNTLIAGNEIVVPKGTKKTSSIKTSVPSTVATSSKSQIHVVKNGDTLWKIASANGLNVTELLNLNNLKTDTIYVGQKLKVNKISVSNIGKSTTETLATSTAPKTQNTQKENYSNGPTHTVKAGETLGKIASNYALDLNEIMNRNGLTKDSVIHVGQVIKLDGDSIKVAQSSKPQQTASEQVKNEEKEQNFSVISMGAYAYTVKPGDTPSDLAWKFDADFELIKHWNDKKDNTLKIGERLIIHGKFQQGFGTIDKASGNQTIQVTFDTQKFNIQTEYMLAPSIYKKHSQDKHEVVYFTTSSGQNRLVSIN